MTARDAVLPTVAAALVAGVLGVQLAHGGGDYTPVRSADPCAARAVASVSEGIDGLGENLVLLGLDGAACRLGVTRESLVLRLGGPGERSEAEVDALRGGLLRAVDRLDADGRLPPVSALAEDALEQSDLPGLVKAAVRALPDRFVDGRLATDDVLRRSVAELDVRGVLADIEDPAQVQSLVRAAVLAAVVDELVDGFRNPFG